MKEFIKKTYIRYHEWESLDKGNNYILNFIVDNIEFFKKEVFPELYKEIDTEKLEEIKEYCIKEELNTQQNYIINMHKSNGFDYKQYPDYIELQERLSSFNLPEEETIAITGYVSLINELNIKNAKNSSQELLETYLANVQDIMNFIYSWQYYYTDHQEKTFETDKDGIIDVYSNFGINIIDDKVFSKFGLIETADFFTFPPRLYDVRIDKTFYTNPNYSHLLNYLEQIRKYSKKIQLQIIPEKFKHGKIDKQLLEEQIEVGQYLQLNKIFTPKVSQLFDYDKDDKLRITINSNGIMFEEMATDFETDDSEVIYTRIVHAQYSEINGEIFITHLDCEFARYENLDKYIEARKITKDVLSGKTLGFGKPIKIFKIDEAKIPFFLENGNCLLLDILELFFKNIDLVKEYFSEIESKS